MYAKFINFKKFPLFQVSSITIFLYLHVYMWENSVDFHDNKYLLCTKKKVLFTFLLCFSSFETPPGKLEWVSHSFSFSCILHELNKHFWQTIWILLLITLIILICSMDAIVKQNVTHKKDRKKRAEWETKLFWIIFT